MLVELNLNKMIYSQTYTNLPGAPLQNCFDLYDNVTSTTPGICLGGV
jgi:hypothetical protein